MAASTRLGRVIAVVAGSGDLPCAVVNRLDELNFACVPVSISGFGPRHFRSFELGEISATLDYLRSKNVTDIIFCGGVRRPSLLSLKLDKVGKRWLASLGIRAFLGDDALLRGIKRLLAKEGFRVLSPQSILNTLLTPQGVLTDKRPSQSDLRDIARGIFVLGVMSRADIGQSVVVQDGIVLGVEAIEGTDRLISRCSLLRGAEVGGVIIKMSKIGQDDSMDVPTIGPRTVSVAAESSFFGIAVGASKSQIIDYESTISLANQRKLFIIGV
jgi:DUF1009 family protein